MGGVSGVQCCSKFVSISAAISIPGEHQMELLDCVAAKFHEEPGVFKLLVKVAVVVRDNTSGNLPLYMLLAMLMYCWCM